MSGAKVLVVDDSLTVRMDLAGTLESHGFTTRQAGTLAEARTALDECTWDAIILDALLPDGDGTDLLDEVRGRPTHAQTPVLMLSVEAEVRDRVRGLRRGADDYIGKPYDLGYLTARLHELVRHHQPSPTQPAILIVEHDGTLLRELRRQLEGAGYVVAEAASGQDGLQAAATLTPRAVLVDEALPGLDGTTVIRRIRLDAALRHLPCILLTDDATSQSQLRAMDAGADTFLARGEPAPVILAKLGALLRQSTGAPRTENGPSLLGPKRILAVDDSPTYLHHLEAALRGEGFEVILAESGRDALQLLAAQPVECVLLDLSMPDLTGLETCRRIKGAPAIRDTPVIILTGQEDLDTMLESFACGADDYVAKSADVEVLKARVQAQLRRKQFEDEKRLIREQLLRHEHETAESHAQRLVTEARAAVVDELQRSNEELSAFSYSISHDLRAPVRAISGFSDILLTQYHDCLPETAREYVHRIRAAALRMHAMIEDLLQLSRVGRGEPQRETVDISALARDILAELRQADPDREVQATVEEGITAEADPTQLRMVLQNLLANAWKFTAKRPDATIHFGRTDGEPSSFYVRDNGSGFDPDQADMLFTPFQRLHGRDEYPGNGIGLAIVHRIINRHRGQVHATGALDRGATFTVSLPAAPYTEVPRVG